APNDLMDLPPRKISDSHVLRPGHLHRETIMDWDHEEVVHSGQGVDEDAHASRDDRISERQLTDLGFHRLSMHPSISDRQPLSSETTSCSRLSRRRTAAARHALPASTE